MVDVEEAGPAGLIKTSGTPKEAASTAAIAAAVFGEMTTLDVVGVFLAFIVSRFDAGVFLRVPFPDCFGVVAVAVAEDGEATGVVATPNSWATD